MDPVTIIEKAMSEAYNQKGRLCCKIAGKSRWLVVSGVSMHILTNVKSRLLGKSANPTHKRLSSTDAVFEASDDELIEL